MNLTNAIVAIALTGLAVLFSFSNGMPVKVYFHSFSTAPMPFYIPIFIAFLTGFIGGMIALSFSRYKHKRDIYRLQRENRLLADELDNLRNIPLQDDL
ncbi:MAG: LapA family protein [Mariprofundaceae bacterium]|nr:LapA family protein [Mariprofundaceae bacterium]